MSVDTALEVDLEPFHKLQRFTPVRSFFSVTVESHLASVVACIPDQPRDARPAVSFTHVAPFAVPLGSPCPPCTRDEHRLHTLNESTQSQELVPTR